MGTGYQGRYGDLFMDWTVDVVLCIDATCSMKDTTGTNPGIIDMVKQNAINFLRDLSKKMEQYGRVIHQLRVRIVAFRDYMSDKEYAMMVTDFFNLPQQAAEFEECIHSIHADGGGDIPEDGLEALAYALRSDWNNETARGRNIVVLWTDADAHPLGFGSKSPYYSKGMPRDLEELTEWWDDPAIINQKRKRLLLFAPDTNNWKYISENWGFTQHFPSVADSGLSEESYQQILNAMIR